MTQEENFLALMSNFGLKPSKMVDGVETTYTLESGDHKVGGYGGFMVMFYFSKDGSFNNVNIWE